MLTKTAMYLSTIANTSLLLIISIIIGAFLGMSQPDVGESLGDQVDFTLLILISFIFFNVRFQNLLQAFGAMRFHVIALVANFVMVPLMGYFIASMFMSTHPILMIGLIIYFMSPCTDWFLSFTRLSGGNTTLGTTLIPINMTVQLLLYPFFLQWFTANNVQIQAGTIISNILQWFMLPLLFSVMAHQLLRRYLKANLFQRLITLFDKTTPWITALLVMQIFASNIITILAHSSIFSWILMAIITFFITTYWLAKMLSAFFQFQYPEKALLTMTIAARNAPLMLAITMAALPNQPLIYAAIVIGMLIEFPHLIILRRALLKSHKQSIQWKTSVSRLPSTSGP